MIEILVNMPDDTHQLLLLVEDDFEIEYLDDVENGGEKIRVASVESLDVSP